MSYHLATLIIRQVDIPILEHTLPKSSSLYSFVHPQANKKGSLSLGKEFLGAITKLNFTRSMPQVTCHTFCSSPETWSSRCLQTNEINTHCSSFLHFPCTQPSESSKNCAFIAPFPPQKTHTKPIPDWITVTNFGSEETKLFNVFDIQKKTCKFPTAQKHRNSHHQTKLHP